MVFTCIALSCGGFHWGEAREGVLRSAVWSLSSRSWSPHVGERVGEAGNPGPRGGRHCKELKIVTFNANTWSSFARRVYTQEESNLIFLGQEHRQRGDQWNATRRYARTRGGNVLGADAASTSDSATSSSLCTSAGTCVTLPASIGVRFAYGEQTLDWSPDGSPGRVTAAWVDILGGMYVVSVYLFQKEG